MQFFIIKRNIYIQKFIRYLKNFDYVNSILTDDLHTVYLGVTKKIISHLIEKKLFGEDTQFDLIDEELMRNHGIDEISSIKGLSQVADWKGKNFMSMLLFHGIPFLKEYLTDQRFTDNFIALNNSIFTLSKTIISEEDLAYARNQLEIFIEGFTELYGDACKTPNFHELHHIIESVEASGPLYLNSTFHFEKLNFEIRKCIRSSLRPDKQVYSRLAALRKVEREFDALQHPMLKEYCESVGIRTKRNSVKYDKKSAIPREIENEVSENVKFISKATIRGIAIETSEYSAKFGRTNSYIYYDGMYGEVKYICEEYGYMFLLCERLDYEVISKNTVKLQGHSGITRVEAAEEFKKMIPTFVNKEVYISERPNIVLNE